MARFTAAAGWILLAVLEAECAFPTNESAEVVVTLEAPVTIVTRGSSVRLTGQVSRRVADDRLEPVPGATIDWRSSDPAVAVAQGSPDGSAIVTGISTGHATISAIASGFKDAQAAALDLRVANAVEIDAVEPDTVRYGDKVTIDGVGLGSLARVSLGEADLIPDSTTYVEDSSGISHLSFWVPYPATTGRATAVTLQGASTLAASSTTVVATDLYHELGVGPPTIDLSHPPVRQPDTLFYNPALALTATEGSDGFRFALPGAGAAITVTVSSETPAITLMDPVLSIGPQPVATFPPSDDQSLWALGLGGQTCRGRFVAFSRPVARTGPFSVVRALKDLPSADLLLGVTGDPPGRYAVTVRSGYHTADPRIGPDRFEENDHCVGADLNFAGSAHFDLPFADTLTIDNPYEVDWYRFSIPGDPEEPKTFLTIRTESRPLGATDSSDLGLLLLDGFAGVLTEAHTVGSSEQISAEVTSGSDYYVVVLDEGGVATRYSLCITIGSVCNFLTDH